MKRTEQAYEYHKQGWNCCQSVLAAFSDVTGISVEDSFRLGAGFGAGAGTGELCGAVSGAVMTLDMALPLDVSRPGECKKRAVSRAKDLQTRFRDIFGALRCQELLQKKFVPDDSMPAARDLGITGHCDMMIVTAVELTEELLREAQIAP